MKNISLSIKSFALNFVLVLLSTQSYCQWSESSIINGSELEPRYSVIDDLNNVTTLSFFTDTLYSPLDIVSYGVRDLLISRFNSTGDLLWSKRIGNITADVTGGIATDNDRNLYITGAYHNNTCWFTDTDSLINRGSGDIFIAKYDEVGNFIWARQVGSSSTLESSFDLNFDGNGKLVMTGFFKDSLIIGNSLTENKDTLLGNTYNSNFIAVFDLEANLIWAKRVLGTNNLSRFRRVVISDNGYYTGGYFQGNLYLDIDTISSYAPTTYDAFIYKTDFNGNGQWVRRIRGSGTENFKTLAVDEYDNVYVLGNYNSSSIQVDSTSSIINTYIGNTGGYDTYIGKYNRSGVLQWFLRKGSSAKDIYNEFVIRNNTIYATGYFANQIIFNEDTLITDNILNEDAFLAAFNEIGDPIDAVSIIGTGNYNDAGTIVNMGTDSRAYVSGYFKSPQIQIGDEIYTSSNTNKSDLFFAVYEHPFTAVITDEKMISCNGQTDGMLEATPYFGTPPYSYSWSHDPSLNDPVADDLSPGTYTVTITDNLGKSDQVSATISQPLPITITGVIDSVSCFAGDDGAIDITVSGGTAAGAYNYFWTSTDGSGIEPLAEDQEGLTEGHYGIQVKDDNECIASNEFYVEEPGEIMFTGSSVTNITMPPGNNGAVDLSVTGGNTPFTYEWTGPGGFSATDEDIVSLSTAGLYSVNVTDHKNCMADTTFAVIDATTMIAQIIDQTDITCFGLNNGTATVEVTNGLAPYSYSWSDGVVITNSFRSGLTPGNHTVTVTDAAMHVSEVSVFIDGPASELIVVLDPDDLFCYNDNTGVVNLTVTGGTLPYSFEWDNGYTGEDLVNIASGTYIVQVTDSKGCIAQGSTTVEQPDPIVVTIDLEGANLCPGDNSVIANANASGGFGVYSYLWNDPGTQITATAYDLEAGNYTVTVTDQNNCRMTESVFVPEPQSFTLTDIDYIEPSCAGDEDGAIVPWIEGGTGGYSYIWSNNVFTQVNSGIPAGTYSLTVVDVNNCIFENEFTLSQPDSLKIENLEQTDLSCSGYPDGIISITPSGGTGNISLSVDNGQNYTASTEVNSLPEGNYIVKITDSEGCESDTIHIKLVKSDLCRLIIYDAFSPNGDSYNDEWLIGNIENYPQCSVRIFNSWGVLVFSSTGYQTPWDGTYNGNDLPSGTYYYIIDPGDNSGTFTGPVSIIY